MESNNIFKKRTQELLGKNISKIICHFKSTGGQIRFAIGNYVIEDDYILITNDRSLKSWSIDWNCIVSIEPCKEKDFKKIPIAMPEPQEKIEMIGEIIDLGFKKILTKREEVLNE